MGLLSHRLCHLTVSAVLLWGTGQVRSQPAALPAAPAAASFAINGYHVLGNTLLRPEQVDAAVATHTGAKVGFETIQQALESLNQAYVDAGFGSVWVEVPEQELDAGIVTLHVVEGVLGNITIEPNAYFDDVNIGRSLPALRLKEAVNVSALNRNLTLANESTSKITNVTFKRSANNRDVDAVVKVTADDPVRWLALLDNTGAAATGLYRTGLVYQNTNLFNRDHSLTVQAMTSPDHVSAVSILGLSYRLPLYAWGDALDFNLSSANVDSGRISVAGGGPDLDISGSGVMLGARYTHNLTASAARQQSLSVGLELRAYGYNVTEVGSPGSLLPDLTTTPLTLGYNSHWRSAKRDVSLSLSWLKNLPGANKGGAQDIADSRVGGDAGFQTFKFSLQHTERFESQWQLRTALSGQQTQDLLIAAEQYGVGGADSVRGFAEREIAGDQGARAGVELWAPPVNRDPWRLIPLAFIDVAWVLRNQPAVGESASQNISSMGLGLRAAWGKNATLRVDWGYVLQGVTGIAGPVSADQRLHASAAWVF